MGFEYALVHLKYTIPPAITLTLLYWPLCTRIDIYKVLFLVAIAVVSTIPWDSYLIRRKIWTYPPSVVAGPKLFDIPAEEVFFFIIQTYNTSLLYLLLSKATFKPSYLVGNGNLLEGLKLWRSYGQLLLGTAIVIGGALVRTGTQGTYLGLILIWAAPFALLLWTLAYQFLLNLPYWITIVPIALPTLYLWIVDTLALRRGTWTIESGTKLGIHVWEGLEIEEAIFFLATNILIVFGLVAFDNALAILEAFPALFPILPTIPSPILLIRALLVSPERYDNERIEGIREAVDRLKKKSRSFYLASSVFSGRLRIDLILLYSFCRVADDLVDTANTDASARSWIARLTLFLDLSYSNTESIAAVDSHISTYFPPNTQSSLRLLPTSYLTSGPLYELLEGFKTDLEFSKTDFPIRDEDDLELYGNRVAGTVAELCLQLVFHHSPTNSLINSSHREFLIHAGGRMGIALQYVNIARDVSTDAGICRVYVPISWLKDEGVEAADVFKNSDSPKIDRLRSRLLEKAFAIYKEAKGAMAQLPKEARAPMRVAVESYMEIGRVLMEGNFRVKAGRATVPKMRRIRVAYKALQEG